MSINAAIAAAVHDKKLHHLLPVEQGRSVERDVFVSNDVLEFLNGDSKDQSFSNVGLRAYRRIEGFICGNPIVFGMDPSDKKSTCLIARNHDVAQGVVDVRVNDPQPAVRLFGCFGEKDVLVLLLWRSRQLLAQKGFARSVRETERLWKALFPKHPPFIRDKADDYISGIFHIG